MKIFAVLFLCVLGAFFHAQDARAMGGLNPSCMAPVAGVVQPAPAIAAGFNCCRICENFGSANDIDVNDTDAAGFRWKAHLANGAGPHYGTTLPASAITVDSNGLTLGNPTPTVFPGLFSANSPDGSGVIVGQIFPNGGYFETNMSTNVAASDVAYQSIGWPAMAFTLYNIFAVNQCPPASELDFWESYPTGSGSITPHMAVGQFHGSTCATETFIPNFVVTLGANLSQLHRIGTLWKTMAENSGTGLVQRYFDGTHLTTQCSGTCDVTYTAGNDYSDLDGSPNPLALYGGPTNTTPFTGTFQYVQAYTP